MSDDPTAPRLTVAVVARRLGIAPATLRTWDRRYGVGPTEHEQGSHRRYGPDDLARLEAMRRLVLDGVAPSEAARAVLAQSPQTQPPQATSSESQFPDRDGGLPRPSPGGRVLSLPGAEDAVRGLARAAMALDTEEVHRCLARELAEHGVEHAWEQVIVPVLVSVGARWEATGEGVEVEHLLADCVTTALLRHTSAVPAAGRPVLLACAPGEQHCIPLFVLAAALAERGQACRLLGAAVPGDALVAAVRRTGPAVLFVWSQLPGTGRAELFASIPVTRPPTVVVVGGPGWHDDLPPRVTKADDLGAALALIGRGLSGEALASSV